MMVFLRIVLEVVKMDTKTDLNWLMKKTEDCSERYMEDENFLLKLLEMNWFKRAFCSFGLILKFMVSREKYKF